MYKVVTVLGGIFQFKAEFPDKQTAIQCAKRASTETIEPVDVYFNGNCIEMFKNGRKY